MTEQHFEIILEALADKIKEQGETIGFQKLRIDLLEKKLQEAETHMKGDSK